SSLAARGGWHRADRGRAGLRSDARRRRGGERPAARDQPWRRRAHRSRRPRGRRADRRGGRRRRVDRRRGRRHGSRPASAPSPARRRVRRRCALPRRRRRLRAAEGSDAGAGADPARAAGEARRPRPSRRRSGGRPRGWPRGDRRAPPPRLRPRRRPARPRRTPREGRSRRHGRGAGRRDVVHRQGRRPRPRTRQGRGNRSARRRRRRRRGEPDRRALARRELRSRARAHRAGGVRHGACRSDPGDPPKLALSCLPEVPKPVANAPHIAYRPGLDGLRAIAVAAVFLYHSRIDWLPGGFLGVDLFFVLSGYLITSLLLVEWEARNRIDLLRFWLRRARRLLPALVVVVLGALVLASIFARQDLARTRGDVVGSLLYFANWHQIVANHSYFNLMGNPSLLQHTWSLGVEEQ